MLLTIAQKISEFGGILAAGISALGVVAGALSQIKIKKHNTELTKDIKEIDLKQNVMIEELKHEIKLHGESLKEIKDFLQDQPFALQVKKKIHCQVNQLIKSYQVENKEFISYLDAGLELSNILIDHLVTTSFFDFSEEFDEDLFRRKAILKLKLIKNNMNFQKLGVGNTFGDDLKALVYKNINDICSELCIIKTGQYNGKSKEKFSEIFVNTTKNIIKDSINFYNDYKKL